MSGAVLWSDVAESERRSDERWRTWRGCPYAVKRGSYYAPYGGYRRCSGFVQEGHSTCPSHDPSYLARSTHSNQTGRAINMAKRSGVRTVQTLRWLTNDEIYAMQNIGEVAGRILIEARDTWDDDRVREAFGFPKPPPSQSRDA